MTALLSRTDDPYARYGIDHFFEKSGLAFRAELAGKPCLSVSYDAPEGGDFAIHVRKNEIRGEITGYIRAYGETVPVFERPVRTGKGEEILGIFQSESGTFPCITLDRAGIDIGFDIFGETGHILSGRMDPVWNRTSRDVKRAIAGIPFLDFYEDLLFRAILTGCERLGIPLVQKSAFPGGKRFAVCCTHDIDEIRKTYQWITYPIRCVKNLDLERFRHQVRSLRSKIQGREPYWTFGRMMELEEDLRVSSTSFFLQETAPVEVLKAGTWKHSGRRYRFDEPAVGEVISKLDAEGHEIGLHGSFNSCRDPILLGGEKGDLEKALRHGVRGIRQHNLRLRIPETWELQEKAGFLYDSTLGFNNATGFRWGTSHPFRPFHPGKGRTLGILELPLIIQDTALFRQPDPWGNFMGLLRQVRSHEGVLTLLWHHPVFNEDEFPGWAGMYRRMIEYCQRENAWIAPAGTIADWWEQRARASVSYEFSDGILRVKASPAMTVHHLTIRIPRSLRIAGVTHARVIAADEMQAFIETDRLKEDTQVEVTFSGGAHGS
jgi:hypothetical protein